MTRAPSLALARKVTEGVGAGAGLCIGAAAGLERAAVSLRRVSCSCACNLLLTSRELGGELVHALAHRGKPECKLLQFG